MKLGDPRDAASRASGSPRSARRSASRTPSPPASSAPTGARCPTRPTCRSSRPTSRSTRATPAARCSTSHGEVVGINSQIFSRTGGYQGVSFAIPIEVALNVEGPARRERQGRRAAASASRIQDADPGARRVVRARRSRAARWSARSRRTARREGRPQARRRDRSSSTARRSSARASCRARVAETKPGTRATLELWRDGKARRSRSPSARAKDAKAARRPHDAAEAKGKLGVAVRPLSAEERKEIGGKDGLVVEQRRGPGGKGRHPARAT